MPPLDGLLLGALRQVELNDDDAVAHGVLLRRLLVWWDMKGAAGLIGKAGQIARSTMSAPASASQPDVWPMALTAASAAGIRLGWSGEDGTEQIMQGSAAEALARRQRGARG